MNYYNEASRKLSPAICAGILSAISLLAPADGRSASDWLVFPSPQSFGSVSSRSATLQSSLALAGRGHYSVVYADPPWKYDNEKSNDPAMGGMTYPTMTQAELRELPVGRLAAKDCCLFLWATMPKLPEALEVIEAWGFKYVTCTFTWVKQNLSGSGIYSGIGHWTNGNAELCLFAKRGSPKRVARNVKQIVLAPRGRHSAKPPEVRDRIVALMRDVPRVELFAREAAEGWDRWGDEVESTVQL